MKGRGIILTGMLLLAALAANAQTIVSGVVTDRQTGKPLPHVSVTASDSQEHTVTNDDGHFTLKTQQHPTYVQLSHIGYKTRRQQLNEGSTENLRIALTSSTVELQEVLVSANDPMLILKAAIGRMAYNYPQEGELTRCFYRETARRGSRFISIAEAVTEMYKSDYAYGPEHDAVAILKGRRLMSMKAKDTLGVKIQGGPVIPLMVDVAKNPEYLLNEENLPFYTLHLEVPVKIDNRLQYVVRMEPHGAVLFPLMEGRLFIDQETLAFTRAELALDMRDWRMASSYMLVHKPLGLRFRPKELTMTIVYETDAKGITRMSYLRNVMRFNCDWKRRLFASTFTTVSEMVVTDRLKRGKEAKRPSGRSSFGIRERFYDKVAYFEDPNFWEDYNIIEPTESLEHAIDKLKKNLKTELHNEKTNLLTNQWDGCQRSDGT
jgi:hypothetical protein